MIDVGGPSMLRARREELRPRRRRSAGPSSTTPVLAELREDGELSLETRARARRARRSRTTAAYDAAIARWFARDRALPGAADARRSEKVTDLSYGENPHQAAAYYARSARAGTCSRASSQLGGKELSYNNLADLEGARRVMREFALPAAVIVKHANPCGVAVAGDDRGGLGARARRRPGLGVRLRRDAEPAGRRRARRARSPSTSSRCCSRPGYDDDALEALRDEEGAAHPPRPRAPRRDAAASATTSACSAACSCRSATPTSRTARRWRSSRGDGRPRQQWGDLLFAWRVCKHVLSNAIVLAQRPADDRHRRRPDEPRRRGADRGREGAGARPRPRAAPCSRATRSSRSPTGRSSRSTPASRRSSSPAARKRDDEVRRRRSSAAGAAMVLHRAAGTSGTDGSRGIAESSSPARSRSATNRRETTDARARPAPLEGARRRLRRVLHDRPRRLDRQRRAAVDRQVAALLARQPPVGHDRLRDHLRRLPAARRPRRRPARAPPRLPGRRRRLHGRVVRLRPRLVGGRADRARARCRASARRSSRRPRSRSS